MKTLSLLLIALIASSTYANESGSVSEGSKPTTTNVVDVRVDPGVDVTTGAVDLVQDVNVLQKGSDIAVDADVDVDASPVVTVEGARYRQKRQVPDAFLNYSFNGDSCIRTLGFQAGTERGVTSFGIPLRRDYGCDLWLAVNEAQENGHILLSYAFMCEIPNVGKRTWGKEKCDQITHEAAAWVEELILEEKTVVPEPAPPPVTLSVEDSDAFQSLVVQISELSAELSSTRRQQQSLASEYRALQEQYGDLETETQTLWTKQDIVYETVSKDADTRYDDLRRRLKTARDDFRQFAQKEQAK